MLIESTPQIKTGKMMSSCDRTNNVIILKNLNIVGKKECSAQCTCSSKGRMMSSTARTSLGCACLMPSYTSLDTKMPAPSLCW